MSRPKGAGAIKWLDATQDEVAMRNALWCGDASHERHLRELCTAAAQQFARCDELRERQEILRATLSHSADITLQRAKNEQAARNQLRDIKSEIAAAETALGETRKQIDDLTANPRGRRKKAVFPWQYVAVCLIMEHKMNNQTEGDGEYVLGTRGVKLATGELRRWLHVLGFPVGERQLRRFVHDACGVPGQQGTRTDL